MNNNQLVINDTNFTEDQTNTIKEFISDDDYEGAHTYVLGLLSQRYKDDANYRHNAIKFCVSITPYGD